MDANKLSAEQYTWALDFQAVAEWHAAPPAPIEPGSLQLDTACQARPEESKSGPVLRRGKDRESGTALQRTSLLLQGQCLGRLMLSDVYTVFGTSF